MTEAPIYMDHHATTPVDARVFEAMRPYFTEHFGNAASKTHAFGEAAKRATQRARSQVAELIGAKPNEIVFTSGATEANNLAIKGALTAARHQAPTLTPHVVTQQTEHNAVLDVCKSEHARGAQISYVGVDASGVADPQALLQEVSPSTVILSLMLSNNEVGTVQRLQRVSSGRQDRKPLLHCDASQGLGYLDFSVRELGVDLASLTAHKMYGPKGIGALFVDRRVQHLGALQPMVDGGGHEQGLRSGTLNVPAIVGFGEACAIMTKEGQAEAMRIAALRDRLHAEITAGLGEVRLNGAALDPAWARHPANLNLSFGGVDGARLLLELSATVAVSSGAACSSDKPGPSHVLRAMGVEKQHAESSVRFGLGRTTRESDVDTVAAAVIRVVRKLRG